MTTEVRRNLVWVFAAVFLLLGAWVARRYLHAFAWAGVIAIATWPLYQRFAGYQASARRRLWAPLGFTLIMALVFFIPLGLAIMQLSAEVQRLSVLLMSAQRSGIVTPPWLARLPFVGSDAVSWWTSVLGTPGGVAEWARHLAPNGWGDWAKTLGAQVADRLVTLLVTLLALFFLYRDGDKLGRQLTDVLGRWMPLRGDRYARYVFDTVKATVNGLVLVGLGEGAIMAVAYGIADLPSPLLWGALTGLLSMVPFGAVVVFGAAALSLVAQGNAVTGVLLFCWGALVLFIADHFVRPQIIGGSAKLPFFWVLIGILGGLESFGLLGLFLGPVIMAIGVALWREGAGEV